MASSKTSAVEEEAIGYWTCVCRLKGGLIPKALAVRGIDNNLDICVNVCKMFDVMSWRNELRSVDRSCLQSTCHVEILGIIAGHCLVP